jgi:nucleoid-associated protein YgaU
MARNGNTTQWGPSWGISRSTLVSGIIAIAVIVGLFVLFNALPAGQPAEPAEEQTEEQQEQGEENAQKDKDGDVKQEKVELPTKYTTKKGDNLWEISKQFYGTGFRWTTLSRTNRLSNPNVISAGQKLTIPKVNKELKKYTVVQGDTLWDISEKFYDSGFDWTYIRDANPGSFGRLPNGNLLITVGQTLVIP